MVAKTQRNEKRDAPVEGCDREVGKGGLHEKIEEECRRRLWFYCHSRTDQRTSTNLGVPDFIIAADNGETLYVECKTKTGKLTTDQLATKLLIELKGHKYRVVRSYAEFLNFVADVEEKHKP